MHFCFWFEICEEEAWQDCHLLSLQKSSWSKCIKTQVETWKVAWFLVFYEGSAVAHWTVHFVLISYMKIWFIYDGDGMNEITAKYTQCQI